MVAYNNKQSTHTEKMARGENDNAMTRSLFFLSGTSSGVGGEQKGTKKCREKEQKVCGGKRVVSSAEKKKKTRGAAAGPEAKAGAPITLALTLALTVTVTPNPNRSPNPNPSPNRKP